MNCKTCKAHCMWTGTDGTDHGKCLVGYVSMTHYDELHDMKAEELAEWIGEHMCNAVWCDDSVPVDPVTKVCSVYDCKECILKWLKQEVKE